jgi:hypothetical protein
MAMPCTPQDLRASTHTTAWQSLRQGLEAVRLQFLDPEPMLAAHPLAGVTAAVVPVHDGQDGAGSLSS